MNQDDSNQSGSFVTVTLRGKKAGQLDFEYQISVSKTSNGILVNLGRSNDAWLVGSEERGSAWGSVPAIATTTTFVP